MNELLAMLKEFQCTVGNELMKEVYYEQQQDRQRGLLDDKEETLEVAISSAA